MGLGIKTRYVPLHQPVNSRLMMHLLWRSVALERLGKVSNVCISVPRHVLMFNRALKSDIREPQTPGVGHLMKRNTY